MEAVDHRGDVGGGASVAPVRALPRQRLQVQYIRRGGPLHLYSYYHDLGPHAANWTTHTLTLRANLAPLTDPMADAPAGMDVPVVLEPPMPAGRPHAVIIRRMEGEDRLIGMTMDGRPAGLEAARAGIVAEEVARAYREALALDARVTSLHMRWTVNPPVQRIWKVTPENAAGDADDGDDETEQATDGAAAEAVA